MNWEQKFAAINAVAGFQKAMLLMREPAGISLPSPGDPLPSWKNWRRSARTSIPEQCRAAG